MTINILDAGCGVGKTTAMINYINNSQEEQRYLYITPFLDEVERIKKSCPTKNFKTPKPNETKLQDIITLFQEGHNIVTTHILFTKFNDKILDIIREKGYMLIMDEVVNTVEGIKISQYDLQTITTKYAIVNPMTNLLEWTADEYEGRFEDYRKLIEKGSIAACTETDNNGNQVVTTIIKILPYKIFASFKKIFIIAYMFKYQIAYYYFQMLNANFKQWYVKDFELTEEPQKYDYTKTKELIKICNNERINQIGNARGALSVSWFQKNTKSDLMLQLKRNTGNFFRHHSKTPSKNNLWTTYKQYQQDLQSKRYIKGFAPLNIRATNQYKNKTAIAYLANRYMQPYVMKFFATKGIKCDQNKFALSEIIQFIMRGGARDGKEMMLYIPSKRMRTLVEEWKKRPND